MSLLEKANRGIQKNLPPAGSSLFARASSARRFFPESIEKLAGPTRSLSKPPVEKQATFDLGGALELRRAIDALPSCSDSILRLWSQVTESLPLAAVALFIPREDCLVLAAQRGFPSDGGEGFPMSFSSAISIDGAPLDKETRSIVAPLLGVSPTMGLRGALMRRDSSPVGLWLFCDERLDSSSPEIQSELGELLAYGSDHLIVQTMARFLPVPAKALLESATVYPSISVFAFNLDAFFEPPANGQSGWLRGLTPSAIRCSFLTACERILSQGGSALAFGDNSVGCILGCSSAADPDLALFQFKKTLKRILPFLAAASFPQGRALRIETSSPTVFEELSAFLSE